MAMYGIKLPYRITEADRKAFFLDPPLEPEQVQRMLDCARAEPDTGYCVPAAALVQVIDPRTGDSLLHLAARSERDGQDALKYVEEIMECFGRDRRTFYVWARHALLVHQNHEGDTALHLAAHTGNQLLLTMLYRYICNHWSAVSPETTDMPDDPPEHDVFPEDLSEEDSAPRLLFLTTKNDVGRDAAAEARSEGNKAMALWLDDVVARLDPDGTRRQETNVANLVETTRHAYRYHSMEKRNQSSNSEKSPHE